MLSCLFLGLFLLVEQSHHAVYWILLLLLPGIARLLTRKHVLQEARRDAFDIRREFRV